MYVYFNFTFIILYIELVASLLIIYDLNIIKFVLPYILLYLLTTYIQLYTITKEKPLDKNITGIWFEILLKYT